MVVSSAGPRGSDADVLQLAADGPEAAGWPTEVLTGIHLGDNDRHAEHGLEKGAIGEL